MATEKTFNGLTVAEILKAYRLATVGGSEAAVSAVLSVVPALLKAAAEGEDNAWAAEAEANERRRSHLRIGELEDGLTELLRETAMHLRVNGPGYVVPPMRAPLAKARKLVLGDIPKDRETSLSLMKDFVTVVLPHVRDTGHNVVDREMHMAIMVARGVLEGDERDMQNVFEGLFEHVVPFIQMPSNTEEARKIGDIVLQMRLLVEN